MTPTSNLHPCASNFYGTKSVIEQAPCEPLLINEHPEFNHASTLAEQRGQNFRDEGNFQQRRRTPRHTNAVRLFIVSSVDWWSSSLWRGFLPLRPMQLERMLLGPNAMWAHPFFAQIPKHPNPGPQTLVTPISNTQTPAFGPATGLRA